MNTPEQIHDFTRLFTRDTPLIDARSPIEFAQGSFPLAQNLALMSDKQRELIGICYKNHGQENAIKLGHKLICGDVKAARIQAWLRFVKSHPDGALYCFRGGLRSQIAQQWIFEASGIKYPRITGGYKAMRQFLINETQRIMDLITPSVIGGRTGAGKTLLLNKINNQIDLEGLANHRGSAFGNTTTPQPTQIDFENSLAIALIKKQNNPNLVFEDEGTNIGTIHIPQCVKNKTAKADLILLKTPLEERIKVSIDAYVINMYADFKRQDYENGFNNFANYWSKSLEKIQKRLGLERYKNLQKLLNIALNRYQIKNQEDGFYPLVRALLVDYYDPMYDYQSQKKIKSVVFQGDSAEVLEYLRERKIT